MKRQLRYLVRKLLSMITGRAMIVWREVSCIVTTHIIGQNVSLVPVGHKGLFQITVKTELFSLSHHLQLTDRNLAQKLDGMVTKVEKDWCLWSNKVTKEGEWDHGGLFVLIQWLNPTEMVQLPYLPTILSTYLAHSPSEIITWWEGSSRDSWKQRHREQEHQRKVLTIEINLT